jgi:hypothetical protein
VQDDAWAITLVVTLSPIDTVASQRRPAGGSDSPDQRLLRHHVGIGMT